MYYPGCHASMNYLSYWIACSHYLASDASPKGDVPISIIFFHGIVVRPNKKSDLLSYSLATFGSLKVHYIKYIKNIKTQL